MTVYLDYIFIENFIIDYILLKETSYISRKNISFKRTIFSAGIASLYVVIMMYFKINQLNYFICKMLLVIIMIYVAFQPKTISEYIKEILLFFLISLINVGALIVMTNLLNLKQSSTFTKLIIYILCLLLSKFYMQYIWKFYTREIKNNDLLYEVYICIGNKVYKYNAFLDTGNTVYSYVYNVPVLFAQILDNDMLKEINTMQSFNIKTVTLASEANKQAYIFEKIEIKKGKKTWFTKAAIVFENVKLSKENSYNMLLNYILYTNDLGGIKI